MTTSGNYIPFKFEWDSKKFEINTTSLELILNPLVYEIGILVNSKKPSKKRKGQSKRFEEILIGFQFTLNKFLQIGKNIADENHDENIKNEMNKVLKELQIAGSELISNTTQYRNDLENMVKHECMCISARNLLCAVTKLLFLAHMIDMHLIHKEIYFIKEYLDKFMKITTQTELMDFIKEFNMKINQLLPKTIKYENDLKNSESQESLISARATLKLQSIMLRTASIVYLNHSNSTLAEKNRDIALRQVCTAVDTIDDLIDEKNISSNIKKYREIKLATALDDIDCLIIKPEKLDKNLFETSIKSHMSIVDEGIQMIANDENTENQQRFKIIEEFKILKKTIENYIIEYKTLNNISEESDPSVEMICNITTNLRRHLRETLACHVSNTFLNINTPINDLIKSSTSIKDDQKFNEHIDKFSNHSQNVMKTGNLVCTMAINENSVRYIKSLINQIEILQPQVINSAMILSNYPNSESVCENMDISRRIWLNQLKLLRNIICSLITTDEFLTVSMIQIKNDIDKSKTALKNSDSNVFKTNCITIQERSERVCTIIEEEMKNYKKSVYTENVFKEIATLKMKALPEFNKKIDQILETMKSDSLNENIEQEINDTTDFIYNCINNIKQAVFIKEKDFTDGITLNKNEEEIKPEIIPTDTPIVIDGYSNAIKKRAYEEAMKRMDKDDKRKIDREMELFNKEKLSFDIEVDKWDESENDIISLAKHMCLILIDMKEFTRGSGPLETTMDIINAAKKIYAAGEKLARLGRKLGEQCSESNTKNDLLEYLTSVEFYSHQLKMTSKVKADVQSYSGFESAASLIENSRNLMSAVISTVKYCYIASTKYPKNDRTPGIDFVWKMRAPDKKPLVKEEQSTESSSLVRKGSMRKNPNPISVLSQFEVAVKDDF